MLAPRLDILPAPQRRLWEELGQVPRAFVLYGGTALALRLAHRTSEDFDFFANEQFSPGDLERTIPLLRGSIRLQSSPNTLVSRVEREGPVKVSFFGGLSLGRVHDPEPAEGTGLPIASLLDLAATKVKVVQDRAEAKDYLDVVRLIDEGIGLGEAVATARAIYGSSFNALLSLKALCYFGDGDLPTLPAETRTRLAAAAGQVDLGRLPTIPRPRQGVRP